MCGLSKNQPFCDGSHKKVLDEPDDKVYEYDEQGHRRKVKQFLSSILTRRLFPTLELVKRRKEAQTVYYFLAKKVNGICESCRIDKKR